MQFNVTLIITTFNEEKSIASWCDSLLKQSCLPDEVVIVDSESTDKTIEIVQNHLAKTNIDLKCIIKKCNISEGRNIAIKNAKFDNILITDAGVLMDRDWVELMSKSLSQNDIVSGYYEYTGSLWFQKSYKRLFYKNVNNVDASGFLPSSRSLALKRACWEKVGGYDESYLIGEDTDFDLKLKSAGYKFFFQREAVVKWELRDSIRKLMKQQYLYSYWDGVILQNYGNLKLVIYSISFFLSLGSFLYWPLAFFTIPVIFSYGKKVKGKTSTAKGFEYIQDFFILNVCYVSKGIGFLSGILKRASK